jgi:arylformamidase
MKIIDLSASLSHGDDYHFPVVIEEHLRHEDTAHRFDAPTAGYAAKRLCLSDHAGTHVDAPLHFLPGGETIDALPADRFVGEAFAADFSDGGTEGGPLPLNVFSQRLTELGETCHAGDIVLLRLNCPSGPAYSGISVELAEHFVACGVKLVGTDQPSIDYLAGRSRPAHLALLGHGIVVAENLCNFDALPSGRFLFVGLPLKLCGATGSPVRAVAIIHEDP